MCGAERVKITEHFRFIHTHTQTHTHSCILRSFFLGGEFETIFFRFFCSPGFLLSWRSVGTYNHFSSSKTQLTLFTFIMLESEQIVRGCVSYGIQHIFHSICNFELLKNGQFFHSKCLISLKIWNATNIYWMGTAFYRLMQPTFASFDFN